MRGSTSAEARMRLVRFSTAGGPPRMGAVLGRWDHWEKIVDLSAVDSAIPANTLEFIDACPGLKGDVWDRALRVLAEAEKIESDAPLWAFRPGDVRIHSPIAPRLLRDFLAFRAHVARTRAAAWAQIPPEWDALPAYYNGNPLNVVGTKEAIPPMRFETFEGRTPRLVPSAKMDYEAEIGFVLGEGGTLTRRRPMPISSASRSSTISRPGTSKRRQAVPAWGRLRGRIGRTPSGRAS